GTIVSLPQLFADGFELLAQEELALALVHALSHLAADLLLQLQIGQRPIGPGDSQFKAPLDIEGLQDLHFLLEGQVGRIAGGVDQGARVGRRTASSTRARVPIRAYRPSILGTTKIAESPACAAAMAFRASSVSKAIVTTIPGSTTPVVRGRRGTTSVFGRSSSRLVFIVSSRSLYIYLILTNETPAAYIPEV